MDYYVTIKRTYYVTIKKTGTEGSNIVEPGRHPVYKRSFTLKKSVLSL